MGSAMERAGAERRSAAPPGKRKREASPEVDYRCDICHEVGAQNARSRLTPT